MSARTPKSASGVDWSAAHRIWPPPNEPWIMYQEWHDLLFIHYEIPQEVLRQLVPPELALDSYKGHTYVGMTPFHMKNVRPRGLPAFPRLSAFSEFNFRTYVKVDDKPGVFFFSLDCSNPMAVTAARSLFHLPYFHAEIDIQHDGPWIRYHSRRLDEDGPASEVKLTYRPVGECRHAEMGSLEYFLAERYCLYAVNNGKVYRCEIHHGPWPLQIAEAEIESNTIPDFIGLQLPDQKPLLHYSAVQPTAIYPIHELGGV